MITSMLGVLRDATKDISNGKILPSGFWALFFVVDDTFLHIITLKKNVTVLVLRVLFRKWILSIYKYMQIYL